MTEIITNFIDRHDIVRRANESRLIKIVAEHHPIGKPELMKLSGLSRPTVDLIVDGFIEKGVIKPTGMSFGRPGRKATLFELDANAGFGLGFDLGGSKLAGAISNIAGEILAEEIEPTAKPAGPKTVAQMVDMAKRLCERADVDIARITQVTVGTPGIMNELGELSLGENVDQLEGVHLQKILSKMLDAEVVVENDVNVAALGEFFHGTAIGINNFALLQIGTGIGCGIFVDGKLIKGHRGGAGETAFLPLFGDPNDPKAISNGLLESVAGSKGIVKEFAKQTGEEIAVKEICQRAKSGDLVAMNLIDNVSKYWGYACASLSAIVDPEMIILSGGIGCNPVFLEKVRAVTNSLLPYQVIIKQSKLENRAGVIGAASFSAERVRDKMIGRNLI
jgi:predicted NBD/HSP70 family sugar kinase